jgi:hypothetical protein
MGKGLIIRTVKTAFGAKALQIIRYAHCKRIIVRHIGGVHTDNELTALYRQAVHVRDDAGHNSSATTDKYIDIELIERHKSARNKPIEMKK